MAEAIVSAITEQLVKVIAENASQKLKLVTGVDEEVKKLQKNFEGIQCVLEDAEEKQFVEKMVRLWLERLKEVAYDMEDVLDEWNTAILKLETDGVESIHVRKKVCPFLSCFACCRQVVRRHDIASKIKEINEQVDVIAKRADMFQLARSEIKQPRRLESTSVVDVSILHGRREVKNKILSTLLGGNNDIQTISIVAMGGIGKTALAQLIFNDHQVQAHFHNVIWACVSDSFDPNKIARAILGGLDQNSLTNLQNSSPLQDVLTKISEKIRSSKFLLVLDDVWTDHGESWDPLKAAFQQGMSGSRILVTTRIESVATGMGSSQVFHLEALSDEVCWLILSQLAFVGKGNELRAKLVDIGREIAKKCRGLPLAAKTLGGLLRGKNTRNEWQIILNGEIWKLNFAQEYIFAPLFLSYYDLPSQVRPCLLYCAIFPKDFVFEPTKLIGHWMAHGYLSSNENSGTEEEKGGEYFNYLASRSFFQDFDKDDDGNITGCKMHDMVHDFVQYLAKEEIVAVEVDNSENGRMDVSSKKTRHLRVEISKEDQFSVSIKGIENLRSLLAGGQQCDVTGKALAAFFQGAKCLRLLDFAMESYGRIKVKAIPNEIGKLIHLRYLNLSGSENLKELPEGVCELHNLQYLNLWFCRGLEKLPDGMGKLINLRYFYSELCLGLQYYPKGIGRLTSLRELIPVMARVDGKDAAKEFSVGDLENLDLLSGDLEIRLVGNEVDVEEVTRAKLHNKRHLERLDLNFSRHGKINPNDVIQGLNLPPSFDISVDERRGLIRAERRSR